MKRRLHGLLGAMRQHQAKAGTLAPAVGHFLKVSRSYWSGLFHCYTVPELPRTDNELEQFFGAYRYHERRGPGARSLRPPWCCAEPSDCRLCGHPPTPVHER